MILLFIKLCFGLAIMVALNFFKDRMIEPRLARLDERVKLLSLALFELSHAFFAIIYVEIFYWLALSGELSLGAVVAGDSSPGFVLWLINPAFEHLSLLSFIGLVFGFISRSFGFSILLVIGLLFPNLISIPGASVLIFSELIGQGLGFFYWRKIKISPMTLLLKLMIFALAVLVFWASGSLLRDSFQRLELNPMLLNDRIIAVGYLCALLVAFNIFLSMMVFHFYFTWTKDGKRFSSR